MQSSASQPDAFPMSTPVLKNKKNHRGRKKIENALSIDNYTPPYHLEVLSANPEAEPEGQ